MHLGRFSSDSLIVLGASGSACVESTIEGALFMGFSVITLSKGIVDFLDPAFITPFQYGEGDQDAYEYFKKRIRERFRRLELRPRLIDFVFSQVNSLQELFTRPAFQMTSNPLQQKGTGGEDHSKSKPGICRLTLTSK